MTDWEFERVAGPYDFNEGPVWTGEAVLFSDIPRSEIRRFDPETGDCTVYLADTDGANGLKIGPDGHLYACEGDGRRVTRYEPDGTRTVVAERYGGDRLNSPNDLAFDGSGRCWFTDPRYGDDSDVELDHRSVYRVDPVEGGWSLDRMTRDTTNPNGILVSPDDETLYVAQSDYDPDEPTELRAYDIESNGSLGDFTILHDFHPHRGVDGMCLTEDGEIVACAGNEESGPGPAVYHFAPDGAVLSTHSYPASTPTNCAFGGEDLSTLYVTGAEGLWRVQTDLTGSLDVPDELHLP